MITKTELKQYFWYLLGIMGVVFFWTGIWDGIGNLGWLKHPLASFFLGVGLLTLSPLFFKEKGSFWKEGKSAPQILSDIQNHPEKHLFHISYHDQLKKSKVLFPAKQLRTIEKEFMVFVDQEKREVFIPLHRLREVLYKGKSHWKA